MLYRFDPKYGFELIMDGAVGRVVKHKEGRTVEVVPGDEPLMLFRGRDNLAIDMLRHYRQLAAAAGCTQYHLDGIDNRIAAFEKFAAEHPEAMKQPGVTEGR